MLTCSHLQNLVPNCILPLNDRYLLIGTNGHLCVYDCVDNQIINSVDHANVLQLVPYKASTAGSIVLFSFIHSFIHSFFIDSLFMYSTTNTAPTRSR